MLRIGQARSRAEFLDNVRPLASGILAWRNQRMAARTLHSIETGDIGVFAEVKLNRLAGKRERTARNRGECKKGRQKLHSDRTRFIYRLSLAWGRGRNPPPCEALGKKR